MLKPLSLYVGLRYTRAKRRNHFISFISLISMFGIALGVTALITVLSVMNGFEKELRERMLGMASHLTVTPIGDSLGDWRSLAEQIRPRSEQIQGIAPYVLGQAMITRGQTVYGTYFQGVLPEAEPEVSVVKEKMLPNQGRLEDLEPGSFRVLIGLDMARMLGVGIGDKITLVVPQAAVTPVGILPRMKRMTVAGLFQVGIHEFDNNMVLMHIDDAAKLTRLPPGHAEGLNIKLHDMFDAPRLKRQLADTLPIGYYLEDWTHRHANFFKAVQMEKRVMSVILALIIAVAAFNIVSTLVMVVTDKEADIAILRTLGAAPKTIMGIFMVQGTFIGVIGTLLGLLGGVSLALNIETLVPAIENAFNVQFLDSSVYYISDLPSDLHWNDVSRIASVSLLLSLLATLYPAWRASRTQPAEALRYE